MSPRASGFGEGCLTSPLDAKSLARRARRLCFALLNGPAPILQLTRQIVGQASNLCVIERPRPQAERAAVSGNGSPQNLSVSFLFWEGVRGPVARVAGPAPPCSRVLTASVAHASVFGVAALALAERRPAQLSFWTQAEGAAKRSGAAPRPGNEVFALLGGTGTGQCPVAVTGTAP
jgi:hypothetical protein